MTRILVTSAEPGAGKTGVAAAIARHYAYQGRAVKLARLVSSESSEGAALDAAYFGSLAFTPGSPVAAVSATDLPDEGDDLVVVEGGPEDRKAVAPTAVVVVSQGTEAVAMTDGDLVVRTNQSPKAEAGEGEVVVHEDRVLAGFSIEEAKTSLRAETLIEGDVSDVTCDHLVIAPIGSDAGQPYFKRFESKAVVVRFDKTDQQIAALATNPACLILSGGRRPSDYLFDAAGSRGVPVLLSNTDTENTVIALEGIFEGTRFQGGRKLDRMAELLDATGLYDAQNV